MCAIHCIISLVDFTQNMYSRTFPSYVLLRIWFFFYEVLWKTTNIQSQKTRAINLDGRLKTIKEPNMLYIRISHWKHKYLIYIYIYMNISSFFSRRYRYTSYRQFVRWIWGYLGGKGQSCATIRGKFPSENELYTGFNPPD